jgi:hypothetical protein
MEGVFDREDGENLERILWVILAISFGLSGVIP